MDHPWPRLVLALVLGYVSCASTEAPRSDSVNEVLEEGDGVVSIHVGSWLSSRERPWTLDQWGLTRGISLTTSAELLEGGGLRIRIGTAHFFSGTDVVVEVHRTPQGSIRSEARVNSWSDENSRGPWKKPSGSILVSSSDWSRALDPDAPPFIVEFRLHDVPMHDYACVHGIVEVPKPAKQAGM